MALPASAPITLSAIQAEFSAANLSAAATAAGVSANMLAFLGKSAFSPTLYDYVTVGNFTWTKPSGASTIDAIVVAGGGAGGGSDGGGGGGGGGGQAYRFIIAISGNASIVVGSGGSPRVNGQGYNGNYSALSSGWSVACTGGTGGYPGGSGYGGSGGASGSGNAGGAGNESDDFGTSAGGGGGNSSAGAPYYNGGGGGAGTSYTITGGSSYYFSPGGNGQGSTSGTPGSYGGGGNGRIASFNSAGQAGAQGRVVFYAY